jgi:sterol desaturase/sphingolipid hydroxylase (fatty acid hydroxylase superfamily)
MIVILVVLVVAVLMMAVEVAAPGRPWPHVAGWWARALAMNTVQAGVVVLSGALWNESLQAHRPWSADSLGTAGGALVGYLVLTFVYYGWHRFRHESPILWRYLHQFHHSAQRIEVITSFYKHPAELLANSLLSAPLLYWIVGLGPEAACGAVLLSGLAELVYHWNVATPVWLGYLFQRPESHCLHHQEGVHTYNFSDLPIWDMLFGTFQNPPTFRATCGLGPGVERQLADLLRGTDFRQATSGEAS